MAWILFALYSLLLTRSRLGFDWEALPAGSVIVDVGGGTGRPALLLAQAFPGLRILVQDKEPVVREGLEVILPPDFQAHF